MINMPKCNEKRPITSWKVKMAERGRRYRQSWFKLERTRKPYHQYQRRVEQVKQKSLKIINTPHDQIQYTTNKQLGLWTVQCDTVDCVTSTRKKQSTEKHGSRLLQNKTFDVQLSHRRKKASMYTISLDRFVGAVFVALDTELFLWLFSFTFLVNYVNNNVLC